MEKIMTIFWFTFCYLYAKNVKEKYPEININPINYLWGGLLFGVLAWIYCWIKKITYNR